MIDEKINKALSELETNLRNVESARKQVENTVNSYKELTKVTSNYVNNIALIDQSLKELVRAIASDYDNKSDSFEKDCKTISESCHALISSINSAVEDIKNTVSSTIDQSIKELVHAIAADYDNKSNSFEKDCKTISESCHALISSINSSAEDIKNTLLSNIDQSIKELVHAIIVDYDNKSDSFEKDCKTISESCHALISSINSAVEDIKNTVSSNIDAVHKKLNYVLICNFIIFSTMIVLYFLIK